MQSVGSDVSEDMLLTVVVNVDDQWDTDEEVKSTVNVDDKDESPELVLSYEADVKEVVGNSVESEVVTLLVSASVTTAVVADGVVRSDVLVSDGVEVVPTVILGVS